jgi:hypothetical protein
MIDTMEFAKSFADSLSVGDIILLKGEKLRQPRIKAK